MSETHEIRILLTGVDKVSSPSKTSQSSLQELATITKSVAAVAMVHYAKQAAKATAETVILGAQSLAARDRLVSFAGGAREADEMLDALIMSSDRTIDRMAATAQASRMLEQGLISTTGEMSIAGAMVAKLGNQTWSTERRISSLTMLLANKTPRRLDDFGLSVERVTARSKELAAQGLSAEQAWKTAVFEEASEKLDLLGDMSGKATTQISQLDAAWKTLNQTAGESAALMVEGTGVIATIAKGINSYTEALALQTQAEQIVLDLLGEKVVREADYLTAVKQTMDAIQTSATWQKDAEEELREAYEKGADAREAARTKSIQSEWESVQASRRIYDLFAGFAAKRAADKKAEAAAIEDANQRMARADADYLTTTTAIYASLAQLETDHAARMKQIAGGGGPDFGKAQQRELARLQDIQDERDWQAALEQMAKNHEARMASIRDRARRTEVQQENERYRAVLDSLSKEQKARMDALKRRYGKTVTGDDARAAAEAEHQRRLLGLYTDSARKQEMKRHEQAIKELEFEEAEANLIAEFAAEKEQAEQAHQATLKTIADQAIQDSLAAERQRYQDQVAAAQERRAQQQADESARQQITQKYDQLRADARAAALQVALAAEVQSYERRRAALQVALDAAELRYARIADIVREGLAAMANEAEEFTRRMKLVSKDLQGTGVALPRYQHGTRNHPGGLAWVGEKEPELLNLPRGTSVTPMSKMGGGGGGVYITNHFGQGSVRSDRDIRRIAEQQERSMRLRGQGVVQ